MTGSRLYAGTQLYLINGLMIVALWVAARILLFLWLFVHMWDARDILSGFPLYVQVSTPPINFSERHGACMYSNIWFVQVTAPGVSLCLFCLNIVWFTRICRGALRLVAPKQKSI